MPCPTISIIDQDEYIGDSLPKINNNFESLSGSICEVITDQSLTSTGYQKLLGDMIFQWGQSTTDVAGTATVTFPKPFPNACYSVTTTSQTAGGVGGCYIVSVSAPTQTSVGVFASSNSGAGVATTFHWMAIGR